MDAAEAVADNETHFFIKIPVEKGATFNASQAASSGDKLRSAYQMKIDGLT